MPDPTAIPESEINESQETSIQEQEAPIEEAAVTTQTPGDSEPDLAEVPSEGVSSGITEPEITEPAEPLLDIEPIFLNEQFDQEQIFAAKKEIFQHFELSDRLLELIEEIERASEKAEKPAAKKALKTNLGVAYWILGKYDEALSTLEAIKSSAEATYIQGLIHLERGDNKSAGTTLEKVLEKDESPKVQLAFIESRTKSGESKETLKSLKKLAKACAENPDYHYQVGLALDFEGEYEGALESYEKALEFDSSHSKSTFRLGYMLALRGKEEEALQYYQRCMEKGPIHTSVLMNVGLLYEDARQYEKAVSCYKKVLNAEPTNEVARLYLKDARSSLDMYYDEEKQTEIERQSNIMNISINDFELSIRCRTALETIGIQTLEDLVSRSEQELLSCKNFGETSLREIKELLTRNHLRLGMSATDISGEQSPIVDHPGEGNILDRLVNVLELSVRSSRCMERLGILTLRDLTEKSERELLSGKNFGRTSLKEIREKLVKFSLKLADDS